MMRDLTEIEGQFVRDEGGCPLCGAKQWLEGPQGGMCTNMQCAKCRSKFNFGGPMLETGPMVAQLIELGTFAPEISVAQRWHDHKVEMAEQQRHQRKWWTDEDFDRARREHKEHWDQVHVRELAEQLHRQGCPYDHTEGCPWSYEEHREDPWEQPTHKQYLEIARKKQ